MRRWPNIHHNYRGSMSTQLDLAVVRELNRTPFKALDRMGVRQTITEGGALFSGVGKHKTQTKSGILMENEVQEIC